MGLTQDEQTLLVAGWRPGQLSVYVMDAGVSLLLVLLAPGKDQGTGW